jgi:uncharacterized protein YndB with AHSA1/START domain
MTRRRETLGRALACACIAALTFGATAAWSQAASFQPKTSRAGRTAMTIAQTAMKQETMSRDLANRSPDIHWPEGFSPDQADLFSHNELRIEASCERVWKHIVEATKWPQWYPNSKDVQIIGGGGELNADSVFRWTTFGLPLESRINEFTPYSRIGWYGYAPGEKPSFYHTWYLTAAGESCLVVTDEVGVGSSAAHLRQSDGSLMHRGHDLWLATLKWMAERQIGGAK